MNWFSPVSEVTSELFYKRRYILQLLLSKDYPSIKMITGRLDYFGVKNVAANVLKDASYDDRILEMHRHVASQTNIKYTSETLI